MTIENNNYLNIASYKFTPLSDRDISYLQITLKKQAENSGVKGSILLSKEGINLYLAGKPDHVSDFVTDLCAHPAFTDLEFKSSYSSSMPYKRLKVKIKPEIISMNQESIQPLKQTAPHVEPDQLKAWLDQKKPVVLLDTRNGYEVNMGSFKGAIDLSIENFSDFPEAISTLPEAIKSQPVVTFCTGGIRCEKAAAYLIQQGFSDVWQLKGGILNYFERCGGDYFEGNCFVFDDRVGLTPELQEIDKG